MILKEALIVNIREGDWEIKIRIITKKNVCDEYKKKKLKNGNKTNLLPKVSTEDVDQILI